MIRGERNKKPRRPGEAECRCNGWLGCLQYSVHMIKCTLFNRERKHLHPSPSLYLQGSLILISPGTQSINLIYLLYCVFMISLVIYTSDEALVSTCLVLVEETGLDSKAV